MSQPTYTEVQAVDPVLTNMLVGYKQSADRFVANRVFPVVPVEKQAFTYYTFTKKYWFPDSMIARAPGAQFARSGYGVESTSGACQLWGLEHPIADEVRANNQTPMALEQAGLQWLAQQSLIRRERAFAAAFMTTGVWGTDNTTATDWDDFTSGDPINDVLTARRTISNNTGMDPNTMGIFSNRHFAALREIRCELTGVVDVPPNRKTTTSSRSASGHGFLRYAREQGIPVFEPAKPSSPDFVESIRELRPDLFLAVGYLNRFREDLLAVPTLLTANFHASLLPAYRGLHPVIRTLRAGERWAGLTVHVVDAGLDTGDILYQVRVRTRREDSVDSLYDRIMHCSVGLVERLVTDAETGEFPRRPQGAAGASYFSSVDLYILNYQRRISLPPQGDCIKPMFI